ncbi:uncharacterized protein METZ01_LOCUS121378 [marine metagenome]|uniref:Uncharacterized protein n=1 Tax=marine metagenome TaxID=408172 RepID=A0A381XUS3_9ZZZZ
MAKTAKDELHERCNAIEESYEYCIAYAAQGVSGESGSQTGGQIRSCLTRTDSALTGLADVFRRLVAETKVESPDVYEVFIQMLERDAQAAQAAVRLALAQPAISSQLVDNLNASHHTRTLLTDVFLVDEILKQRLAESDHSSAS